MNKLQALQNAALAALAAACIASVSGDGCRDLGPYLVPAAQPTAPPEPTPTPDPWTDEDVQAIARVLSGECYDDKAADKRRVAETVLNRVSAGGWGDTVIGVVTAKGQFVGYWHPHREVTDNDIEIAEGALRDWYAGGCEALSSYLYFSSGSDRENVFRP
ncbi:MAG: cell wall hydrolase [Oscillospiraceae bacterium]|jgi:hypothetical protein|nr:cell wall hydrolase [Oscillospiraceae bacterium]